MKIEKCLEKWLKKQNINIENENVKILKEAFLAGYNQAIEDRRKIDTLLRQ
jgi:hypothetical protein